MAPESAKKVGEVLERGGVRQPKQNDHNNSNYYYDYVYNGNNHYYSCLYLLQLCCSWLCCWMTAIICLQCLLHLSMSLCCAYSHDYYYYYFHYPPQYP